MSESEYLVILDHQFTISLFGVDKKVNINLISYLSLGNSIVSAKTIFPEIPRSFQLVTSEDCRTRTKLQTKTNERSSRNEKG